MNTYTFALYLMLSLCLSGILSEESGSCGNFTDSASCCNSTLGCAYYDSCENKTAQGISLCLNSSLTSSELNDTCGAGDHNDTCPKVVEDQCESFNSSTCCSSGIDDCKYISCESDNSVKKCINQSNVDSFCKGSNFTDQCASEIKDSCTSLNQTQCCAEDSGCTFIKCMKGDTTDSESCQNKTQVKCGDGTDVDDKTCSATPTTQAPVDECTALSSSDDCCKNSNCRWVNCTSGSTNELKCMMESKMSTACVNTCKSDVTTAAPSTAPPAKTTASPRHAEGQHFDGASFIGGMILAFGIVALIFFGCKCYKARQERNYHTL